MSFLVAIIKANLLIIKYFKKTESAVCRFLPHLPEKYRNFPYFLLCLYRKIHIFATVSRQTRL